MTQRRARGGGRVTIRDVAREAGVSVTTVSHALNSKGTIASNTRQRVLDVAIRLGYRAHPVAQRLRTGRSGVLGLDIRPLDSLGRYGVEGVDHFSRLVASATFAALDRGFSLMLVPDISRQGPAGVSLWADGYIIEDPVLDDAVVERLMTAQIPVVTVGRDPQRPDFRHWIGTDDHLATKDLLDMLWASGRRRIAVVVGTDRSGWNIDVEDAYRSWVKDRMLPILVRVPESSGEAGGEDVAARLLSDGDRPDAVYCQTGRHAAGVASGVLRAGLRIPADVMVAAGSDCQQTRFFHPPITSLDLRPEQLAHEAVEMLVGLLGGEEPKGPVLVTPRLIERSSTAARPTRAAPSPTNRLRRT